MGSFAHVLIRSSLLLAALLIPLTPAAGDPAQSAQSEIRDALKKWTSAFNSGATGSVCDLFARDLIANYQGQPEHNYESLCKLLQTSLKDTGKRYHHILQIKGILVSGNLGIVRLVRTLEALKDGRQEQIIEEPLTWAPFLIQG